MLSVFPHTCSALVTDKQLNNPKDNYSATKNLCLLNYIFSAFMSIWKLEIIPLLINVELSISLVL